MMDFLIYDVKVAVLIAVFYMFYRLMLSHETFHRVNRLVLLTTAVASFVLPLCVFTMHKTVMVDYEFSQLGELTVNEPVVSVVPTDNQPSVILTTVLPVHPDNRPACPIYCRYAGHACPYPDITHQNPVAYPSKRKTSARRRYSDLCDR